MITLCQYVDHPVDCSPPGSTVHGILQARILEWVAVSFSRGSSWPRDRTLVSWIDRRILYHWATREICVHCYCSLFMERILHVIQKWCPWLPTTTLQALPSPPYRWGKWGPEEWVTCSHGETKTPIQVIWLHRQRWWLDSGGDVTKQSWWVL